MYGGIPTFDHVQHPFIQTRIGGGSPETTHSGQVVPARRPILCYGSLNQLVILNKIHKTASTREDQVWSSKSGRVLEC
jgi:hypothetical protein